METKEKISLMSRFAPIAPIVTIGIGLASLTLFSWNILFREELSCSDWTEPWFFEKAEASHVKKCLASGNDPQARDKKGWAPLHAAAARTQSPAVIIALVEALQKSDLSLEARDNVGNTPLHLAARYTENQMIITTLLEAGADINAKNQNGETPLQVAKRYNEKIITNLVEAETTEQKGTETMQAVPMPPDNESSKMTTQPNIKQSCPDWLKESFFETATAEDVRQCLATGANVNAQNTYGETPLHIAAGYSQSPEVIIALLEAGADPLAQDNYRKTPWDYIQDNFALKETDVSKRLNKTR